LVYLAVVNMKLFRSKPTIPGSDSAYRRLSSDLQMMVGFVEFVSFLGHSLSNPLLFELKMKSGSVRREVLRHSVGMYCFHC
jgi:hypothetical protein